jgi:hypothetical protein
MSTPKELEIRVDRLKRLIIAQEKYHKSDTRDMNWDYNLSGYGKWYSEVILQSKRELKQAVLELKIRRGEYLLKGIEE